MRELKFRAWDTKLKKYIPWNPFIQFDDPEYVIQQFTGLIDEQGKEIFEGDIILYDPPTIGVVAWDNYDYCGWSVYLQTGAEQLSETFNGVTLYCEYNLHSSGKGYRVLGNIFENIELIK